MTPGTRLGPYEVVAPIGAGGMGEVLRARDTKLGREVAIKVLPAAFAQDPERVARFRREAQILAALHHPNIASVFGLEEDGPTLALVMELVDGEDLAQRLKRGPVPADEALAIARQIAEALEEAHEKGIVHRDLKPANVKVTAEGKVKVLDFGLAKAFTGADATSTPGTADLSQSPTLATAAGTQAGVILGTAAYMSPEQARGKAVDRRADIWAFGVVVHEMLTGRRLFDGETVSDVLAAVLTREPDFAAAPPRFRRLLRRCLDKDPRQRLRHVGDAWLLLDDEAAPASSSPAPRAWTWAAGAAIAAALATWAVIAASARPPAPAPVAFAEAPAAGTRFVGAPLLSPDGRRLAWIARDAQGQTRLWTRELGDAAPRALDGTEGAAEEPGAIWSPDGQHLAFVAAGQVRRVAAAGGPVSPVVAAEPRSGVWLKDGDLLLAIGGIGLRRVAANGGSLRPADGFTSEEFRNLQIDGLDVSADGRHLLFAQFGGDTGLYIARLDGSERRLLYPGAQSRAAFVGSDLIVRHEGNGLVAQRFDPATATAVGESFPVAQGVADFAGSDGGGLSFVAGATRPVSRLAWFDRDGKAAGHAGAEGEYEEVALSRGGRWLGFARADPADGNVDVWLQPVAGGAPARLTSDPDVDHLFTISHDEREVAWEAHQKGALNLARRPADGSAPARVVRTWGKAGGPVDWSPDGRHVLYHSGDGASGSHLWAVPADGPGDAVQVTAPDFGGTEGQFSPDGRHLAFTARVTGAAEVYVQRIEGLKLVGGPVRVSESGGHWPQWRRDGAELYFVARGTVFAAEFHAASDRLVGQPRPLFALGQAVPVDHRPFAPMPDGRRFVALVSAGDPTPHPATVILDWTARLGARP